VHCHGCCSSEDDSEFGFQLYSVRGEFRRNVAETLKKLSQIGYQAVEFGAMAAPRTFIKDTPRSICGVLAASA